MLLIKLRHVCLFPGSPLTSLKDLLRSALHLRLLKIAALQRSLSHLMDSLKATATKATPGGRKTPQKPMEYQYTGEVFLEIFCNPNIWATPFAAKVLLTVRDDRIRLTTEAELSRLMEDVNQYLEQAV